MYEPDCLKYCQLQMKSAGNAGKILNKSAVKSLNLHDPAEMKTSRAHTLHGIKDKWYSPT